MKSYIVATNADYTILCLADNKEQAQKKANAFYKKQYGESRNDWTAYELSDYLNDSDNNAMAIKSWTD